MGKNETNDEQTCGSLDKIKEIVLKVAREGWNPVIVDKNCTEDYLMHYGGEKLDRENLKEFMGAIHHALPDLHFEIEDIIAENDKVVTRWKAEGAHKRAFQGVFPTNRKVSFTGITISRVKGEKIAEDWEEVDQLNFTQQFGVYPDDI